MNYEGREHLSPGEQKLGAAFLGDNIFCAAQTDLAHGITPANTAGVESQGPSLPLCA